MNSPPKWTIKKIAFTILFIVVFVLISLILLGSVTHAMGLVDDTINANNDYSKYALENYQLDFYVDNSWGWLPWNWGDGIGKSVMYGLYAITNFIWIISLYLSNATGYLIQEAYKLDFISQTADAVGKNIQTIAGVNSTGFSTSGFYVGFLLILILVLGIYVTYVGLLKRETTKAIQAITNFFVVFILSASFIAYAPDYIIKINEFSSDISQASLDVGTKIILPDSESKGRDSVDLIRDSLFSIQIKQPWLLLQFGDSNVENIGAERVEGLVATSPYTNNGTDRENIIKDEIENKENSNLTITKTINRLGIVFFLFLFNIGISVFIFLLTGIMIFSQVLFIIYAMFLPVSFLLSMIPTFNSTSKRAVIKLFNVIMTRAGITLIITIAFSISTMLYSLSSSSPFFMTAFLQIVTFVGIYFKLGDLMSMFALQSSDSQTIGKRMMRKPRMLMQRQTRKIQRKLGRRSSKKTNGAKKPKKKGATPTSKNPKQKNKTQSAKPKAPIISKKIGQKPKKSRETQKRLNTTNSSNSQNKRSIYPKKQDSKKISHKKITNSTPKYRTHAKNKSTERINKKQNRNSVGQKRVTPEKNRNKQQSRKQITKSPNNKKFNRRNTVRKNTRGQRK